MKKVVFVLFIMMLMCSYKSQAQFDFIIDGLSSIGKTFLSKGSAKSIKEAGDDIKLIKEAIDIVDGAICMLEKYDYNQPEFYSKVINGCRIPTDFEMDKQLLDRSIITLAQELSNAVQSLNIIAKVLGDDEDPPEVDRENVARAIEDSKSVLVEYIAKAIEMEKKRKELGVSLKHVDAKFGEIDALLSKGLSFTVPDISKEGILEAERKEEQARAKARTKMEKTLGSLKSNKSAIFASIIVIMLGGTVFSIAKDPTQLDAELVIGIITVIVIFSVLNLIW